MRHLLKLTEIIENHVKTHVIADILPSENVRVQLKEFEKYVKYFSRQ